MNAVEIEESLSTLAAQPFDAEAFPYAFLKAIGNTATTIDAATACGNSRVVHAIKGHTSIGVRVTAIAEKF